MGRPIPCNTWLDWLRFWPRNWLTVGVAWVLWRLGVRSFRAHSRWSRITGIFYSLDRFDPKPPEPVDDPGPVQGGIDPVSLGESDESPEPQVFKTVPGGFYFRPTTRGDEAIRVRRFAHRN